MISLPIDPKLLTDYNPTGSDIMIHHDNPSPGGRRGFAVHEAGHLVVGLADGGKPTYVRFQTPCKSRPWGGLIRWSPGPDNDEAMILAGWAADDLVTAHCLAGSRAVDDFAEWSKRTGGDWNDFVNAAGHVKRRLAGPFRVKLEMFADAFENGQLFGQRALHRIAEELPIRRIDRLLDKIIYFRVSILVTLFFVYIAMMFASMAWLKSQNPDPPISLSPLRNDE